MDEMFVAIRILMGLSFLRRSLAVALYGKLPLDRARNLLRVESGGAFQDGALWLNTLVQVFFEIAVRERSSQNS